MSRCHCQILVTVGLPSEPRQLCVTLSKSSVLPRTSTFQSRMGTRLKCPNVKRAGTSSIDKNCPWGTPGAANWSMPRFFPSIQKMRHWPANGNPFAINLRETPARSLNWRLSLARRGSLRGDENPSVVTRTEHGRIYRRCRDSARREFGDWWKWFLRREGDNDPWLTSSPRPNVPRSCRGFVRGGIARPS